MEVNITINKSRVKCYKSLKDDITETSMPDKQEFEIELYNDTPDVVLAKIDINNKPISYSGLILNLLINLYLIHILPKKEVILIIMV